MTKARQDFIDHLNLRGFSNCTIDNYIENVSHFACFSTNHQICSVIFPFNEHIIDCHRKSSSFRIRND
jgi:hypothetical protein